MLNKREKASPCGESREAASHTVCESPATEWGGGGLREAERFLQQQRISLFGPS